MRLAPRAAALALPLALLPLPARAQKPAPAPAAPSGVVEPMPVRWLADLPGTPTVYTLVAEPSGGVVALVRERDATAVVWLSDAGGRTRHVALADAPNNTLMRMVRLADGTIVLAGQCPVRQDYEACTRTLPPGARSARPPVRYRESTSLRTVDVASDGSLVLAFDGPDGPVTRTTSAGPERWRYVSAGRMPTQATPLADGGVLATTVEPSLATPAALVRLDRAGRAL